MSIQTIIEILATYQNVAADADEYEVLVPGDVLDAMIEHLEKLEEDVHNTVDL